MRIPTFRSTPLLAALLVGVLVLAFFLQIGIISVLFDRLGLTESSALLLAATSFLGSAVNLPLVRLRGSPATALPPPDAGAPGMEYRGTTLLTVNVGGCLVPLGFCIYLFNHVAFDLLRVVAVIVVVAAVSYRFSRLVPGLGISIPILLPPLSTAVLAALIAPQQAAATAYIAGTLGVLIGADVLHVSNLRKMHVPVASIGGAGTFDGVFLTGLLAALLA
jgi:uncharacterized membrane protein